ncbi:hypothetical protein FOB63_000335 [Clavispora lusitaniae]|uniref:uncharacterized protein n=1 Tax=Clavispora lusitaniae TaxID=36911 RepID=UPI00202C33F9|nr:hypothetical protein FOB63_000335 [Clavispora lusitaniae]
MKQEDQETRFKTLIDDLVPVLSHADKQGLLQKEVIPKNFFEKNPNQIIQAHQEYIESQPTHEKTSVTQKLKKGYHNVYEFYHDIKLVAGNEIAQHEVGSDEYVQTDFFYKFATEILLREVGTIGLRLQAHEIEEDTLGILRDDFDKISNSYTVSNGEIITYLHKYEEPVAPAFHGVYGSQQPVQTKTITQPLFTSLIGKSSIDPRNSVVPDPYQLAKVVGSSKALAGNSSTFRFFSKATSRIPPLSQAPAQVLDSFFHPNWYTIEAPKWLIYKERTLKPPVDSTLVKNVESDDLRAYEKKCVTMSFAPTSDSRNSVLSEELKTSVWLNHIGLKKVEEIRRSYYDKQSSPIPVANEVATSEKVAEVNDKTELISIDNLSDADSNVIKLENLASFNPEAYLSLQELKKEKSDLVKSPREVQKAISIHLLQLNKLRQQRFLQSGSIEPSSAELVVYKKIVKLMTLLAETAQGQQVSLALSKKLPVLLNEYHGVLPGPLPQKNISSTKAGRLSGIRGPYKKRGRFA